MTAVQRVQAVLAGQQPDQVPVSFWYHFPPDQVAGQAGLDAHLRHLEAFDLDFLKVMDDNGYPHAGTVASVGDLASITERRGDEPEFARQLELIGALKRALGGRVLMTTTIFNAWAVLRHLVRPPTVHRPPDLRAEADQPSQTIKAWHAEIRPPCAPRSPPSAEVWPTSPGAASTRAPMACSFPCAMIGWMRNSPASLYDALVAPSDLAILQAAAAGRFNMLHVCGRGVNFRRFAGYPAHVINWADRAAGPAIADVKAWVKPAICAGVDNLSTLPNGTPADVESEVADARRQAAGRPIMISPGCTYDPARVPRANLEAMCRAARRPA